MVKRKKDLDVKIIHTILLYIFLFAKYFLLFFMCTNTPHQHRLHYIYICGSWMFYVQEIWPLSMLQRPGPHGETMYDKLEGGGKVWPRETPCLIPRTYGTDTLLQTYGWKKPTNCCRELQVSTMLQWSHI